VTWLSARKQAADSRKQVGANEKEQVKVTRLYSFGEQDPLSDPLPMAKGQLDTHPSFR